MNEGRKICLLTPRFPVPEIAGDVVRINNVARQLKRQGHTLVLVSFTEVDNPDVEGALKLYDKVYTVRHSKLGAYLQTLKAMMCGWPMQRGYYRSADYKRLLNEVIKKEQPDTFLAHMARMTSYLEDLNLEDKSIVEMSDAFSLKYKYSIQTKGFSVMKLISRIERKLIYKYEKKVIGNFPRVVLVSSSDIEYLQREFPESRSLKLHSNGVTCANEVSLDYDAEKICFIGNMRSLQNQDAVLHFVNEILPRILAKRPNVKFYVVGAEVPSKIQRLANDHVVVTGYVENLIDTIKDACLTVAPMTVATGIQNKVLISMANGIPVVMSSRAANGIPEITNGKEAMVCDDEEEFANGCLALIEDREQRNGIGQAAYDLVRTNYSWEKQLSGYAD